MEAALVLVLLALGSLAAGILIGRYYVPDDRILKRSAKHATAYMKAINHLLARERDAAVDVLKDVVSENVDDVEPYFALGALFRSRGECERAIRVHQAIELRVKSNKGLRLRARYALGQDFRAAGMPRRATRAMEEVLLEDAKHAGALVALCGLYEEQGRYSEAALAWQRLSSLKADLNPTREHHLLCAAAQRSLAEGDLDAARRHLRDAERRRDDSPHFLVVAAEVAEARGNHDGAVERLIQALAEAPHLASELMAGLVAAEGQRLGEEADEAEIARAAVASIERAMEQAGRAPELILAAAELRSRYDAEAALAAYREVAVEYPEMIPARIAAARLALGSGDAEEISSELRALVSEEGALGWAEKGIWRCTRCGSSSDQLFWRCDQCRDWGSATLDSGLGVGESPDLLRERRARPRALVPSASRALPASRLESPRRPGEAPVLREGALGRARSWLAGTFRRNRD